MAQVVCPMLGSFGGQVVISDIETHFGSTIEEPMQLKFIQCQGDEESIFDCSIEYHPNGCAHYDDLGVICD